MRGQRGDVVEKLGDMYTTALQNHETSEEGRGSPLRGPHVACPPFHGSVVALGGELKNTVCHGAEATAVLSEPHGDLACADNYRRFVETVSRLRNELGNEDFVVAHDLHPTYLSTQFARKLPQRRIAVQHHHAHAVACAIDAGVDLPVIGVVCDGTGYGEDRAIWGGEVLLCDVDGFQRMAHLDYFALPGGDAAARFPWRPALSILRETFQDEWPSLVEHRLAGVDASEVAIVVRQLDSGLNTPATSSLGRLFDAVAALLGICVRNEHEGQAAMALESLAGAGVVGPHNGPYGLAGAGKVGKHSGRQGDEGGPHSGPYEFGTHGEPNRHRTDVIDWRGMVRGIIQDLDHGTDRAVISRRFHTTLAAMFASAVARAADATGVNRVVLSGGCFLNQRLRRELIERLTRQDLAVAVHRQVSPGDAGLSLGQAVIASAVVAKCRTLTGAN